MIVAQVGVVQTGLILEVSGWAEFQLAVEG